MDEREARINERIRDFLNADSHNWLATEYPTLYALVKSEVEAGKAKEDILKGCSRIKKMNHEILDVVSWTIDHLLKEVAKNSKEAALDDWPKEMADE